MILITLFLSFLWLNHYFFFLSRCAHLCIQRKKYNQTRYENRRDSKPEFNCVQIHTLSPV